VRLFVAVWPPPEVLDEIAGIARPAAPGVRWTTADQWHVTLRFLGEMETPGPVVDALTAVALPSADGILGEVVQRLGRGVLCVAVDGLDSLAGAVTSATAAIGRPPEPRPFHGHLTIARDRGARGARGARGTGTGGERDTRDTQGARGTDLRHLAGARLASHCFTVSSVAVVRSQLGGTGARYETLAEVACG
jgi:2'-5' RNA ligase